MGSEGSDWKLGESQESGIVPHLTSPPQIAQQQQWSGLPHSGKYPKFYTLQCNMCTKTKKYGPNENIEKKLQKKN